jgi:WD40 repeat protein
MDSYDYFLQVQGKNKMIHNSKCKYFTLLIILLLLFTSCLVMKVNKFTEMGFEKLDKQKIKNNNNFSYFKVKCRADEPYITYFLKENSKSLKLYSREIIDYSGNKKNYWNGYQLNLNNKSFEKLKVSYPHQSPRHQTNNKEILLEDKNNIGRRRIILPVPIYISEIFRGNHIEVEIIHSTNILDLISILNYEDLNVLASKIKSEKNEWTDYFNNNNSKLSNLDEIVDNIDNLIAKAGKHIVVNRTDESLFINETSEMVAERELRETGKILGYYNYGDFTQIQTLTEHTEKRVNSVVFSSDGKWLASGSLDKTIIIWKKINNSFISFQTLKGHSDDVNSVAFSPDGKWLASASNDRTIKIWRRIREKFSLSQTLSEHNNSVEALSFSSDGNLLASGSYDNTIVLWKKEQTNYTFKSKLITEGSIYSLDFSPNGNLLASGSEGRIFLWQQLNDIYTIKQTLKVLEDRNHLVNSVSFSPDGKLLVSSENFKNHFYLWKQLDSGGFILDQTLKGNTSSWISSVKFSPDNDWIVSGTQGKSIIFWNKIDTLFTVKNIISEESFGSTSLDFSKDGKYLVSGKFGRDETIIIYSDDILGKIKHNINLERSTSLIDLKQFFISKGEFETEIEYNTRLKRGAKEKQQVENKYNKLLFNNIEKYEQEIDLFKKKRATFITSQIRKSQKEITLSIQHISQYNADNEEFIITINNEKQKVKIPRTVARSFKENWTSAKVSGIEQLLTNLENYEVINISITDPVTGGKYSFGKQRTLGYANAQKNVYITAILDNIRQKPNINSSIVQECRKGDIYSYLGDEYNWYKIRLPNGIIAYTHHSNGELKSETKQNITLIPPELKMTLELIEPSGDGFLDAGEKGGIVVKITNIGKGPAFGLILDLQADTESPGLSYSRTRVPGEIQPSMSKTVTFDIFATKTIKRNQHTFKVTGLESNGFEPDPALISFETYPIQLPEFSLVDYGIKTPSGDSIINPGEVINIKARIQNIGAGDARNIKFKINCPSNVFFSPESKQELSFSEILVGEFEDIDFSILVNNKIKDKIIITIVTIEENTQKSFTLPLEINKTLQTVQQFVVKGTERENIAIKNVGNLSVDIAKNIPLTKMENTDAYAIVIGNRDYLKTKNVDYAINDALLVNEYLINTFGFRNENIFLIKNATKADFELYFGTEASHKGKLYNGVFPDGMSDIFIFYSGHGSPDLTSKKSYFVPVDADPMYITLSGYSTELLYRNLSLIPSNSVIVVLDACFSGAGLLKNISPVTIQLDNSATKIDNCIIFTSSEGHQVSTWYPEKQHGMFTYWFLKSIHNKNGDLNRDGILTSGEIFSFISDRNNGIPRYARKLHNVEQDPVLIGDNNKVLIEY